MDRDALDALQVGARATVARLARDTPVLRRLAEMGLVPGAEVAMIRRAPLGDPLQIWLRGCAITIRRRDAKEVEVQLCAKSPCAAIPIAARRR